MVLHEEIAKLKKVYQSGLGLKQQKNIYRMFLVYQ